MKFHTKIEWENEKYGRIQTADGKDFIPITRFRTERNSIKVYIHGGEGWIEPARIPKNQEAVNEYKVIIPRSGNPGSTILGRPKISEPNSCSSNSYVVAIPPHSADLEYVENMISYLKSNFVRFLIAIKTTTQDMPPKAYHFVPMQDFSKPWADEELYAKYGLTDEEIAFIESMIKPME